MKYRPHSEVQSAKDYTVSRPTQTQLTLATATGLTVITGLLPTVRRDRATRATHVMIDVRDNEGAVIDPENGSVTLLRSKSFPHAHEDAARQLRDFLSSVGLENVHVLAQSQDA